MIVIPNMPNPFRRRRSVSRSFILAATAAFGIVLAACQPSPPVEPTAIPSASPSQAITRTLTPSASPTQSTRPTDFPTPQPYISPTPLPTNALQQVIVAQPTATLGPQCYVVKAGETLYELIYRAGYPDLGVLPEVRRVNNIPPDSTSITVGQTICIPRPTPTPLPQGYAETEIARATELPQNGSSGMSYAPATYVIKKGEVIGGIALNLGVSLKQICDLNPPPSLVCPSTCDFSNPIAPKCRIPIVEGRSIIIPGPTMTPTITPTLTGSETATVTPLPNVPVVISPAREAIIRGTPQLLWIDTLLKPGEFYYLAWTEEKRGLTQTHQIDRASFRFPQAYAPPPGETYHIYWQIGIARQDENGVAVLITPMSEPYSFWWEG